MDSILLARLQFTLTICFHYIFPQITIGLSWLITGMLYRAWRTSDNLPRIAARFWIRVFSVLFVLGVATGIPMEFQFGTNWAAYSRFVGDIFGAPLAAEVILAFFLESTFLALLVYGERRLSPRMHWIASLMVALGATLSAFWIIAANSWMQTPAGYHLVDGRAELTGFAAAVFNPSTIPRFLHTIDGALIAGAFVLAALAAVMLIRNNHREVALWSLKRALLVGAVAACLQLPLGHFQAVQIAERQPEKLAVFEGLFETGDRAPLLLFGLPDADAGRTRYRIALPGMLSVLVSGKTSTVVRGLDEFPREEWPPLLIPFVSFHVMVGLGMLFIAAMLLGLFLWRRGALERSRWFLWLLVALAPLAVITNELGWIAAEVGRQPWIVYRVFRTSEAISAAVPAGQIVTSIVMFSTLYLLLAAAGTLALVRIIRRGPDTLPHTTGANHS